jgi:hypothetical protein
VLEDWPSESVLLEPVAPRPELDVLMESNPLVDEL